MKMKKNSFITLIALMSVVSLVACSSPKTKDASINTPNSTSASKSQSELKPLELVDKGYGISKGSTNSYIFYGLLLRNPNDDFGIKFPTVRITARAADGKILGTEDVVLSDIYPSQTIAAGFQAFSVEQLPETVDFEVLSPKEMNVVKAENMDPKEYITLGVENTSSTKGTFGRKFSGEVVNKNTYDIKSVAVTIIFKDASGKIVGGYTTYCDGIKANGKLPFEISPSKDIVTETYEVYAKPWM